MARSAPSGPTRHAISHSLTCLLLAAALLTIPAREQVAAHPQDLALSNKSDASVQVWVTEPTGKLLQNASVVILNSATGAKIQGGTNSNVILVLHELLPGNFDITASFPGFRDTSTIVTLEPGVLTKTGISLNSLQSTLVMLGDPSGPVEIASLLTDGVTNPVKDLVSDRPLRFISIEPLPPLARTRRP